MRKKLTCIFSVLAFCIYAPAYAKNSDKQLSALQIQAIQSKEFEADKEAVFSSVMSVLQDSGYRIRSADLATGLITGIGATETKKSWISRRDNRTPVVSAFVEQFGKITKVRLNFVVEKVRFNGLTTEPQGEEIILDQEVYRQSFEKIDQALFIRKNMQPAQ